MQISESLAFRFSRRSVNKNVANGENSVYGRIETTIYYGYNYRSRSKWSSQRLLLSYRTSKKKSVKLFMG
jgi:hypothetical protein